MISIIEIFKLILKRNHDNIIKIFNVKVPHDFCDSIHLASAFLWIIFLLVQLSYRHDTFTAECIIE